MKQAGGMLILTGWGLYGYAGAAALALRKFPQAELRGVSKRRLPELLEELSRSANYARIIILGVGLDDVAAKLSGALRGLKRRKVKVEWISARRLPDNLVDRLDGLLLRYERPQKDENDVTAVAAEFFRLDDADLRPYVRETVSKSASKEVHAWRLLLDAAMFAHRDARDETAYPRVIGYLARGEGSVAWSLEDRKLYEYFQRNGRRELLGSSSMMVRLREKIARVANSHARVLILGESGTGKETVALQLHAKSSRCDEPFICFNCASVAPELLESRFLGHEKGAFTGAAEQHRGVFEQAHRGTVFLDEIGDLPLAAQGVLLRVLEEGRFMRLGGSEEVEVDVRVISATNRDLGAIVREGQFRSDLFYRLNVVALRLSPLREHHEDIAEIANACWIRLARARPLSGQVQPQLSVEQIKVLRRYGWPGNVRELCNVLECAAVTGERDFGKIMAELYSVTDQPVQPALTVGLLPDNFEQAVRLHVRSVYQKHERNLTETAQAMDLTRNTVRKYLSDVDVVSGARGARKKK